MLEAERLGMPRRLSLRARLVLGVIVLAAAGLAAANVATYTSLRSFLLDRTDESLTESRARSRGRSTTASAPETATEGRTSPATPGDYVEVRAADGRLLCEPAQVTGSSASRLPRRRTCRRRRGRPGETAAPTLARYFTASSADGDALPGPGLAGGRLRRDAGRRDAARRRRRDARPAAADRAARHRRRAGRARGPRPLGRPARAAAAHRDRARPPAAIAAGDLSRRVERAEPDTEVGRLGLALNAMLGQIESRSTPRRPRSGGSGASSPTRRTSCARRSRPCARTPSSSSAAPTAARTTSRAR